jgi:hypothetical protein
MEPGLSIKFLWHDTDVVEVTISASNGAFGGSGAAYINRDDPRNAAAILDGFPRTPDDKRDLRFGTMDPQFAGGGATLRFFCIDGSGHSVVEVHIAAGAEPISNRWCRPAQSAHFFADVEAAAIDNFVRELNAFDPYESGSALLRFATR